MVEQGPVAWDPSGWGTLGTKWGSMWAVPNGLKGKGSE